MNSSKASYTIFKIIMYLGFITIGVGMVATLACIISVGYHMYNLDISPSDYTAYMTIPEQWISRGPIAGIVGWLIMGIGMYKTDSFPDEDDDEDDENDGDIE